jgi:hypothetical protein
MIRSSPWHSLSSLCIEVVENTCGRADFSFLIHDCQHDPGFRALSSNRSVVPSILFCFSIRITRFSYSILAMETSASGTSADLELGNPKKETKTGGGYPILAEEMGNFP